MIFKLIVRYRVGLLSLMTSPTIKAETITPKDTPSSEVYEGRARDSDVVEIIHDILTPIKVG